MNEKNQPKKYDLVLGGNNPPPVNGLVLGGITGVKRRLESNNIEVIKSALSDAIAYKDEGLDLVIHALSNPSQETRKHAVNILRNHKTVKAEQALLNYDLSSLFVQFSDWNLKDFNLEFYLDDPVDTSYRIDLRQFNNIISELEIIEPQGSKIEALYCPMWSDWYDYDRGESLSYKECVNLLLDAHEQLPNLKALFLADETSDGYALGSRSDYKRYKIWMDEIRPLLEAYPKLELLQLQCHGGLDFSHIQHNCLKSLIVEARSLSDYVLKNIMLLDLPELEYLELWLGKNRDYRRKKYRGRRNDIEFLNDLLMPLLFEDHFPNLKYLGLCSCEWADDLIDFLKNSPIIKRLRMLNLSRGTLTDKGAEILLNCPAINNLHTLNVSMNLLSPEMVNKLSQLNCNVIAEPQDIYYYNENYGTDRYLALYE
ncbi:hypothetical protein [Crocosphaera chwakensis]|uniref:Leucine rich repeat variant n=1 Tax=Crocosphaera chwakensis CCY0110 TaxID=391612 RepID=A3ITC1_9CHRO|nr:hypothetical protein [Crocosphaera chwakensis]EAZ90306.1 hypothetical protein CY0110_04256 [Crocosphaera chwakensis CCY0110]